MPLPFNMKIFEGPVDTSQNGQVTDSSLEQVLAQAETSRFRFQVANGAGTSPTLTVDLEQSFDRKTWETKENLFNAQPITTSSIGNYYASDTGTVVGAGFFRLKITMGGSGARCDLKVWMAGHSN